MNNVNSQHVVLSIAACCSEKNVKSECRRLCSFDVLGAGSLDFSIALSCMDQLALIISCASGKWCD